MDLHQNINDGRLADANGKERIPVFNPACDTTISRIPDPDGNLVSPAHLFLQA